MSRYRFKNGPALRPLSHSLSVSLCAFVGCGLEPSLPSPHVRVEVEREGHFGDLFVHFSLFFDLFEYCGLLTHKLYYLYILRRARGVQRASHICVHEHVVCTHVQHMYTCPTTGPQAPPIPLITPAQRRGATPQDRACSKVPM